jgi:hypothetical protein
MGVDFFPCDFCGESICDCGPYLRCRDICGRRWCDTACAELDGFLKDEEEQDNTCNFCRLEDVEDGVLLRFVLNHFNLPIEEAKKMCLEHLKKSTDTAG